MAKQGGAQAQQPVVWDKVDGESAETNLFQLTPVMDKQEEPYFFLEQTSGSHGDRPARLVLNKRTRQLQLTVNDKDGYASQDLAVWKLYTAKQVVSE